jgi:hypothetical protein
MMSMTFKWPMMKFYKISLKKLKDVKHEKDSLVTKLFEIP